MSILPFLWLCIVVALLPVLVVRGRARLRGSELGCRRGVWCVGIVLLTAACANPLPSVPADGTSTGLGGGSTSTSTSTSTVGPSVSTSDGGSGSDETGPPLDPACGDGAVVEPEQCDLGRLNGAGMYCTEGCTVNVCGDGYVGPGEACDDGNDSNEDECTSSCGLATCGDDELQAGEECDEGNQNSETGDCLPSCIEAACGDAFIHEGIETCDGSNVGDQTCELLGFSGGMLLCAEGCLEFDTSNCFACGDGSINPGEECDGAQLGGETCVTQGFDDGTLACSPSCTFDASSCVSFACGNGVIDGADECDGVALGGESCVSQGFDGGTLTCSAGCTFDTTSCYECGDGSVDPGEDCDGAQLGGATCQDVAMPGDTASGGMPACNASCVLTEGTCTFCGDGMREGTEDCDGAQLGSATCDDFAGAGETASGGMPGCNASCMLTEGTCTFCGNGVREPPGEQCDGAQFGGASCATIVGAGSVGGLVCTSSCTIDSSDCCLNNGQLCMGMDALCCDGSCNVAGNTQC